MDYDPSGKAASSSVHQWPAALEKDESLSLRFDVDLASDALPSAAYFRAVAERMGEDGPVFTSSELLDMRGVQLLAGLALGDVILMIAFMLKVMPLLLLMSIR